MDLPEWLVDHDVTIVKRVTVRTYSLEKVAGQERGETEQQHPPQPDPGSIPRPRPQEQCGSKQHERPEKQCSVLAGMLVSLMMGESCDCGYAPPRVAAIARARLPRTRCHGFSSITGNILILAWELRANIPPYDAS